MFEIVAFSSKFKKKKAKKSQEVEISCLIFIIIQSTFKCPVLCLYTCKIPYLHRLQLVSVKIRWDEGIMISFFGICYNN